MNGVLILQTVGLSLALPFGVLSLAIARRSRLRGSRREGWLLTGWCFVMVGSVGIVQAVTSNLAVAAGSESAVWRHYLAWGSGANYARLFPTAGLAAGLIALSLWRDRRTLLSMTIAAMAATVVMGFAVGWAEGPLGSSNHIVHLAVATAATVLLLLGALLLAAATDVIDQLLWLALATYTLKQALSVSLFSILAWMAFSPEIRPMALYVIHVAGWVFVLLFALRRYHAAMHQREVPALFERVDSLRKPRVLT